MTAIAQSTVNIKNLQGFGRIGGSYFAYLTQDVVEKAYSLGKGKIEITAVNGPLAAVEISKEEAIELKELATLHNMVKVFLPTSKTSWVFWLK